MSDTYSYEVLEPGGHARLVGNVLDRISEASANPASAVGSSRAMLGDTETASWMERTTAADGAALIESVRGNTLVWNQLNNNGSLNPSITNKGVILTKGDNGAVTISGTATENGSCIIQGNSNGGVVGHKYLVKGCPAGGGTNKYFLGINGEYIDAGSGGIWIANNVIQNFRFDFRTDQTFDNVVMYPQLFDLTAMFGAGNEPSTVAEFEALFPLPYYPYDPGSLLPVRMDGIETVGFNQWDEEYLYGQYNAYTGEYEANTRRLCSKYPISIAPNTAYYVYTNASKYNSWLIVVYYDANMNYLSYASPSANRTFTTPVNAHYMHFNTSDDWNSAAYDNDICINLSDPTRNGTYEPYWSAQRAIAASTYFPDGMRSAGTVRDELTATQAITRVGERAYQSGDESDASVITDGTVTHYALDTPTTTPIDPPLPLSYRTGAGGIERVMVASGTTSAPPIFATRYPLDPADLAASIAPVDGPTAKSNHQVGDLIMLGFTLCKATQVIVTGETIEIGTNVTKTSVAAELAALSE